MKDTLVRDILNYLDCPPHAPTLRYLNPLIHAYIRRVPWESVSRILKRRATSKAEDCRRLPEEFWSDALQHGFGGSYYESSLAFYSLSTALDYKGYLTVNDMGERQGKRETLLQAKTLPRALPNLFHMPKVKLPKPCLLFRN